jgi:hypothetical protein
LAEEFPRFRREALLEMQDLLSRSRPDADTRVIQSLRHYLSSSDFASLLLPVNGQFVPLGTSTHLTLANCQLPQTNLILEYPVDDSNFVQRAGNYQHEAVLLIVDRQTHPEQILLWSLARGLPLVDFRWNYQFCTLLLNRHSEVTIRNGGKTYAANLTPYALPGVPLGPIMVSDVNDYAEELRVLAQLSMICRDPHVQVEKLAAPEATPAPAECYRMKCTGPTQFQWLPSSGMSTP